MSHIPHLQVVSPASPTSTIMIPPTPFHQFPFLRYELQSLNWSHASTTRPQTSFNGLCISIIGALRAQHADSPPSLYVTFLFMCCTDKWFLASRALLGTYVRAGNAVLGAWKNMVKKCTVSSGRRGFVMRSSWLRGRSWYREIGMVDE